MADKSPRDVAVEVMESVKAEIRAYEESLVKMRAAEVGALKKSLFGLPQQAESNKQIVAKVHKPAKTVFDILGKSERVVKSEEFIDTKEDADPAKRYVHVGAYDNKAEPKKPYPAPGSGGKLEKDALDAGTKGVKPPKPMALKPAGVPAMSANAAPKPPKAPGAPGMVKDELEHQPHPGPSESEHQKKYSATKQAESEKHLQTPVGNTERLAGNDKRLKDMKKDEYGDKKPGVFARLHAIKAQQTASQVGSPATQNLAAAKVLTSRVMAKKPMASGAPSPVLKSDVAPPGTHRVMYHSRALGHPDAVEYQTGGKPWRGTEEEAKKIAASNRDHTTHFYAEPAPSGVKKGEMGVLPHPTGPGPGGEMAMSETKKSERTVFEILRKSAPKKNPALQENCPYCTESLSVCQC